MVATQNFEIISNLVKTESVYSKFFHKNNNKDEGNDYADDDNNQQQQQQQQQTTLREKFWKMKL
jgi:hypothetical protein